MKFISIFFISLLTLSLNACAKEDKKSKDLVIEVPTVVVEVVPVNSPVETTPKFKLKMICKDLLDRQGKPVKNADGTIRQTCQEIKVREKYEGRPVPGQK
jgi:hypothetical protein